MATKESFASIEGMRMWLAWWVVLGHAVNLGGGLTWIPQPLEILLINNSAAVSLFIIVSGFVITHLLLTKRERYLPYITRRFMRIAPIYLLCLVAAIAMGAWHHEAYVELPYAKYGAVVQDRLLHEETRFWGHLWAHLSLFHGLIPDTVLKHSASTFLGPAWSLSLEWQFYLIAPVLIGLMTRNLRTFAMVVAVLLALGLYAKKMWFVSDSYWLDQGQVVPIQFSSLFFVSAQYFLIGIASRMAIAHLPRLPCSPWALLIAAVAAMQYINSMVGQIWSVFFVFCLFEAGLFDGPTASRSHSLFSRFVVLIGSNRLIRYLGRISYSTYLGHIPIFVLTVHFYRAFFGVSDQAAMQIAVACAVVSVLILSPLMYQFVEKPFIAVGRRLAGRFGESSRTEDGVPVFVKRGAS